MSYASVHTNEDCLCKDQVFSSAMGISFESMYVCRMCVYFEIYTIPLKDCLPPDGSCIR